MKSLHKSTNRLKKITHKKNGQKTSVALIKEDIYLVINTEATACQ